MKVGIIGWGRIGRAIFRIANQSKGFQVVAIDDINPNIENITMVNLTNSCTLRPRI